MGAGIFVRYAKHSVLLLPSVQQTFAAKDRSVEQTEQNVEPNVRCVCWTERSPGDTVAVELSDYWSDKGSFTAVHIHKSEQMLKERLSLGGSL